MIALITVEANERSIFMQGELGVIAPMLATYFGVTAFPKSEIAEWVKAGGTVIQGCTVMVSTDRLIVSK